jgi:toxin-antitoxin system PIN domain toxin
MHHARVRTWWAGNAGGGWATCPPTQNGFVRIISQPSYPGNRSIADAVALLRAGTSRPGHDFWPDSISVSDQSTFDHARLLGPNQITDAYLLALAVKNGGPLVTFDRSIAIALVRGAEQAQLVVL